MNIYDDFLLSFSMISPGAPPAPVRLPGQKKFLKKNFSPFSGLDGGSSQQTVEVGRIFIGA